MIVIPSNHFKKKVAKLSKKIKSGRVLFDEFGNPMKSKTGYIRSTDDGGHLLANIFGGPSEQINVLPMTNEANKIVFKKIENILFNYLLIRLRG